MIAALLILSLICFLSALLMHHQTGHHNSKDHARVMWDVSSRIHDVTDLTMRRMLEEALRSMGNQRLQGPMR